MNRHLKRPPMLIEPREFGIIANEERDKNFFDSLVFAIRSYDSYIGHTNGMKEAHVVRLPDALHGLFSYVHFIGESEQ